MPYELISMAGGAVGGFLMKAWAQSQQNKKEMFEMAMKRDQAQNQFYNEAAKRTSTGFGRVTRRIIVFAILSLFLALMFMPVFDINTVVEEAGREKGIFWGLISWTSGIKFHSLEGYYLPPEVKYALLSIMGFYMGSSSQNLK